MTLGWILDAAEAFWEPIGTAPPFPRDLTAALPLGFPVAVVVLPALALDRVEAWLARRGGGYRIPCGSRRLRGCLVAYAGTAIAFVDGADPEAERRFTLAHKAAHFLLDYLHPRQQAIRRLGPGIVAVLDGRRAATQAERIDAVLADCPIGVHVHLLERDAAGTITAEDRADQLARELLAPRAALAPCLPADAPVGEIADLLVAEFGFPAVQAAAYARQLDRECRPPPSFVDWLRP